MLQPGIERQAAGRISRIGQTRASKLLRLIVRDTIESRIVDWQTVRMQEGATGASGGALSLNEFHKCIREAELGLTRKEINRLMQEVDADQARRGHGSSAGHRSNG